MQRTVQSEADLEKVYRSIYLYLSCCKGENSGECPGDDLFGTNRLHALFFLSVGVATVCLSFGVVYVNSYRGSTHVQLVAHLCRVLNLTIGGLKLKLAPSEKVCYKTV